MIRKLLKYSRGYPLVILLVTIMVVALYGSVRAASVLYPSHGMITGAEHTAYMYGGGSCYNGGCIAWDVGINGSTNLQWAGTQLHFSTNCPSNTGGSWLMGADTTTDGGSNQHFECGQGGSANFNIYTSSGIHTTHFQAFQQETVQNGQRYNIIFSGFQAFGAYDTTPPTDPTFNNEAHGLASGTTTNSVKTPTFNWNPSSDAESGIDHYNIYWGPLATGTTITTTAAGTSYSPSSPQDGTYYLRVQAVNGATLTGNWVDMFTYVLDTTPPAVVGACTEGHNLVDNTWQNTVNNPTFTWAKPSTDTVSYLVYWGNSATGTTTNQINSESYAPIAPVDEGNDYVRLASQDALGNTSAWTTCFTYKYDISPPVNFSNATDSVGSTNDLWQHTVTNPTFSSTPPVDGLSGWNATRFYFGKDAAGMDNSAIWLTTNPTTLNEGAINTGTNYLRAQSRDLAGNLSSWQTIYTFKYDNVLPTSNVVVAPPAGTWTNQDVIANVTGADADSGLAHIFCKLSAEALYTDSISGVCSRTATTNDTLSYYVQDVAGNDSAIQSLTITNIDKTAPNAVSPSNAGETNGAISGQCRETKSPPTFTWTAPAVGPGESPITGYQFYFGQNPNGTDNAVVTGLSLTPAGELVDGTHYYFRVAPIDAATNVGSWATIFDWCYKKPPVVIQIINIFIPNPTATLIPTITPTLIPTATFVPTEKLVEKHQPEVSVHLPTKMVTPSPPPQPTQRVRDNGVGGKPLFTPVAIVNTGGGLVVVFASFFGMVAITRRDRRPAEYRNLAKTINKINAMKMADKTLTQIYKNQEEKQEWI